VLDFHSVLAAQQPEWGDETLVRRIRGELRRRQGLVDPRDVKSLSAALAGVAAGEALVIQAGDCAEDPADCTTASVARKAALLEILGGFLKLSTRRRVVRVGRMAGQFAKPRTQATEWAGGRELPVFRGHMVNSPEPDPAGRVPDPRRMLDGYEASRAVLARLGWHAAPERPIAGSPTWVSHEALLLDYEVPLLRRDEDGRLFLSSTHCPWIGERTRQPGGAHVALLSRIINPVACKIGPSATADEVLALAESLDPERIPGRLTFIARMGADIVGSALPRLVSVVRTAGHPVIWLSDPMHGNTLTGPDGLKTRCVAAVMREVREFPQAVRAAGGIAGGLHLEATPDDVTECVQDTSQTDLVRHKYLSLCDPRLNLDQALAVVSAWTG
jgi:3-deoxy-7-phosphoheptulonate synthase